MLRRIWTAAVARSPPATSGLLSRRPLACLTAATTASPIFYTAAAAAPTSMSKTLLANSATRSNLWKACRAAPPQPQLLSLQLRTFASKKHKNLLRYAKGYRGRSKNCFRIAVRRVEKAWQYAYRDRRRKKREWRKLWIMRLQAAMRQYGYRYSQLIPALRESRVALNRKVLAEVAANEPFAFYAVVRALEATNAGLQARSRDVDEGGERMVA